MTNNKEIWALGIVLLLAGLGLLKLYGINKSNLFTGDGKNLGLIKGKYIGRIISSCFRGGIFVLTIIIISHVRAYYYNVGTKKIVLTLIALLSLYIMRKILDTSLMEEKKEELTE